VENYISNYTGGLGLDAIRFMEDTVFPKQRETEAADIPVVGRLFSRQKDLGQSVNDFYDKFKTMQQAHAAHSKLLKDKDVEGAKKYKPLMEGYDRFYQYSKAISDHIKANKYAEATDLARKALRRDK
jgi:hypothetical protein